RRGCSCSVLTITLIEFSAAPRVQPSGESHAAKDRSRPASGAGKRLRALLRAPVLRLSPPVSPLLLRAAGAPNCGGAAGLSAARGAAGGGAGALSLPPLLKIRGPTARPLAQRADTPACISLSGELRGRRP